MKVQKQIMKNKHTAIYDIALHQTHLIILIKWIKTFTRERGMKYHFLTFTFLLRIKTVWNVSCLKSEITIL